MKLGPRVLHTGMLAAGLLWMHAVTTHAQQLPIGTVTGGTTSSENTATFPRLSIGFIPD